VPQSARVRARRPVEERARQLQPHSGGLPASQLGARLGDLDLESPDPLAPGRDRPERRPRRRRTTPVRNDDCALAARVFAAVLGRAVALAAALGREEQLPAQPAFARLRRPRGRLAMVLDAQ
jgi:hypothetical protein